MANNCVAYSCYVIFAFLGFWTFFSIVGAIHYAVWYSHFDLADVHIRTFNVTPELELSYDMDIMIAARHFSSIRRIEQYSYEIRTSHVGMRIGASSVPGFHPGGNKTLEITTTQNATRLPMGDLGALVAQDLNATGRVALRVYIEGQVYTPLFLAQKNRRGWTCDLIVSPGKPFGSQIYDRKCCGDFNCLQTCSSGESDYCCRKSPNCCQLPPSSIRSTTSICG
jgi:hypothetical protein